MNKIIGLYESSSKGKTATLNLLIDLLEVATTGNPMPQPQPKGYDRRKTFTYKGLKIGVATDGDTGKAVRDNCIFFDTERCDIVFSATRKRTDSHSVIELEKYAKQFNLSIDWIRKDINIINQTEDIVNLQQANSLFNLI